MGSIIGLYLMALIFLSAAYAVAYFVDGILYSINKGNKNRTTIKVGLKWLFWRCKKTDSKEIFRIIFVHELIAIILLISATIAFVLALIFNNEYYILAIAIVSFLFGSYFLMLSNIIESKIKKLNTKQ